MDKLDLIIKLIATQDAKQWNEIALLNWAATMANLIIERGNG